MAALEMGTFAITERQIEHRRFSCCDLPLTRAFARLTKAGVNARGSKIVQVCGNAIALTFG
jgi:hypothetical protein